MYGPTHGGQLLSENFYLDRNFCSVALSNFNKKNLNYHPPLLNSLFLFSLSGTAPYPPYLLSGTVLFPLSSTAPLPLSSPPFPVSSPSPHPHLVSFPFFSTGPLPAPSRPPFPLHSLALDLFSHRRPLGPYPLSTLRHWPSSVTGAPLPLASFGQTGPNEGPLFSLVWSNRGPPFSLAYQAEQNGLYSAKQNRTEAFCSALFGGSRCRKGEGDGGGAEEGGVGEGGDKKERKGDEDDTEEKWC